MSEEWYRLTDDIEGCDKILESLFQIRVEISKCAHIATDYTDDEISKIGYWLLDVNEQICKYEVSLFDAIKDYNNQMKELPNDGR